MAESNENDNICCPELEIFPCGDTEEHSHLVCGFSKAILTNSSVKNQCIGDFSKCILQGKVREGKSG